MPNGWVKWGNVFLSLMFKFSLKKSYVPWGYRKSKQKHFVILKIMSSLSHFIFFSHKNAHHTSKWPRFPQEFSSSSWQHRKCQLPAGSQIKDWAGVTGWIVFDKDSETIKKKWKWIFGLFFYLWHFVKLPSFKVSNLKIFSKQKCILSF